MLQIQILLIIQHVHTEFFLKLKPAERILNWGLKVTGKFEQSQPIAEPIYHFILQ